MSAAQVFGGIYGKQSVTVPIINKNYISYNQYGMKLDFPPAF
jgi:hypothetical protein